MSKQSIYDAIQSNDLALLQQTLSSDPDLLNPTNGDDSPLWLATYNGQPSLVAWLLNHGAEVNAKGEEGKTPLHVAAEEGELEVARLLVEHGANLEAVDGHKRTPLQAAALAGRGRQSRDIAELLLRASVQLDLNTAARLGRVEPIRAALAADPRAIEHAPFPDTILEDAIQGGSTETVALLLDSGVSPERHAAKYRPPIFSAIEIAVNLGNFGPLEELVKHGINTNIRNTHGDSIGVVLDDLRTLPSQEPISGRIEAVSKLLHPHLK
jgi:ankyrin repeat protein